jgi:hypothetical protein
MGHFRKKGKIVLNDSLVYIPPLSPALTAIIFSFTPLVLSSQKDSFSLKNIWEQLLLPTPPQVTPVIGIIFCQIFMRHGFEIQKRRPADYIENNIGVI